MTAVQEPESTELIYAGLTWNDPDPFIGACPSWCKMGTHTYRQSAADRTHHGAGTNIPLSLERGEYVGMGEPMYLEYAELDTIQNYRDVEPHFWLGKSGSDVGFKFTPAEVKQLHAALGAMIEAAGR